MIRTVTATTAALALVLFASGASAREMESRQVSVSLKHVNFDKPQDVRGLYTRINALAVYVCDSDLAGDPLVAEEEKSCQQEAVASAVRDIARPELTQLAAGHQGQATQMADRGQRSVRR